MVGYVKFGVIMPNIKVANVYFNVQNIKNYMAEINEHFPEIVVFPELSLTSLTLKHLYLDKNIIEAVKLGVNDLINETMKYPNTIFVFTYPYMREDALYDVACVVKNGKVYGIVPKTKFEVNDVKNRIFEHKINNRNDNDNIVFSKYITFNTEKFSFCITYDSDIENVNEDIVINIADIKETINVDDDIKHIKYLSKKNNIGLITVAPGPSESTTNFVYFGRSSIMECGEILVKNDMLTNSIIVQDVDIDRIKATKKVHFNKKNLVVEIDSNNNNNAYDNLNRPPVNICRTFDKTPYINKKVNPYNYSMHIINMLAVALSKRLIATNTKDIVLGVSGGLDSTCALLVAKKTMEYMDLDKNAIHAYSLPSFGTSDNSSKNVFELLASLDVQMNTIDIKNLTSEILMKINHDVNVVNNTYENAQARLRTNILLNIANDLNAIFIGTGDLSEIALGFATFGGDQFAMYNVNGSLPKTLIRYIITSIAKENMKNKNVRLATVLNNILSAPISPELMPLNNGVTTQKTEEILGDYIVQDFIIYNYLTYHYDREKLFDLACRTFCNRDNIENNDNNYTYKIYDKEYIDKCLNIFYDRFYKSGFKRTASCDFPYIGLTCFSNDIFSMPNDVEM